MLYGGGSEEGVACRRWPRRPGGGDRRSEFFLRGGGGQGVRIARVGRCKRTIAAGGGGEGAARRMGRSANVVTNYSTLPLREIFAGEEARLRTRRSPTNWVPRCSTCPGSTPGPISWAQVLTDDLAAVERSWSSLWDDAIASDGWERWLISGRLAAIGPTWTSPRAGSTTRSRGAHARSSWRSRGAGGSTWRTRRRRWAGCSRLKERRRGDGELLSAVALADGLGSPLLRWQARAVLAVAERRGDAGTGEAEGLGRRRRNHPRDRQGPEPRAREDLPRRGDRRRGPRPDSLSSGAQER